MNTSQPAAPMGHHATERQRIEQAVFDLRRDIAQLVGHMDTSDLTDAEAREVLGHLQRAHRALEF